MFLSLFRNEYFVRICASCSFSHLYALAYVFGYDVMRLAASHAHSRWPASVHVEDKHSRVAFINPPKDTANVKVSAMSALLPRLR